MTSTCIRPLCSQPVKEPGYILCEEHFDIWRIRKLIEKYPELESYFGKEKKGRNSKESLELIFNRIRNVFTPEMMTLLFKLKDLWYGTGELNSIPVEIEGVVYHPWKLRESPYIRQQDLERERQYPRELKCGEELRYESRFHVYKRKEGLLEKVSKETEDFGITSLMRILIDNGYESHGETTYKFGNEYYQNYDEMSLILLGVTIDALRRNEGVRPFKSQSLIYSKEGKMIFGEPHKNIKFGYYETPIKM